MMTNLPVLFCPRCGQADLSFTITQGIMDVGEMMVQRCRSCGWMAAQYAIVTATYGHQKTEVSVEPSPSRESTLSIASYHSGENNGKQEPTPPT